MATSIQGSAGPAVANARVEDDVDRVRQAPAWCVGYSPSGNVPQEPRVEFPAAIQAQPQAESTAAGHLTSDHLQKKSLPLDAPIFVRTVPAVLHGDRVPSYGALASSRADVRRGTVARRTKAAHPPHVEMGRNRQSANSRGPSA